MSIFGDAWRAAKKLKARDFIKAAEAVAKWLKRGEEALNPLDSKTQIAALVAIVAIFIKVIFKIELPQAVQDNIVEVVGGVVLIVLYLLRASNKKIEDKLGVRR